MNAKSNEITKNIPHFRLLLYVLGFNFILIVAGAAIQSRLPPQIPLFYGQPKGESQLAGRLFIMLPPALAVAITGVNVAMAQRAKVDFIKSVLIGLSAVVTILSGITVLKIITLVGNIL